MTEHIVNFAVGIDDDAIIKYITEGAGKQIMVDLECGILNSIFKRNDCFNSGNPATASRFDSSKVDMYHDIKLKDCALDVVKEVVEQNKDKIFELAADRLVDSYKKTKKWKELVAEKLEEEEQ